MRYQFETRIKMKWFKHCKRSYLKEDCRKLGVNLITAGFVGGFVTHIDHMRPFVLILLVWLAMFGAGLIFWGLYKAE
jgi:hypothetical protein